MIKPIDAYLMFLQTNSVSERKKLLPIIFSDSSVALSFLRKQPWNFNITPKLFLKAFNIVINSNDYYLLSILIKDEDLFTKLNAKLKVRVINKLIELYSLDAIKFNDTLSLMMEYKFSDCEQKTIFDTMVDFVEKKCNSNVHVKFCIATYIACSEQNIWNMVYKVILESNIDKVDFLLKKQNIIILNNDMKETLKTGYIEQKLLNNFLNFLGV